MLLQKRLKHEEKFSTTAARLVLSDAINLFQYELFINIFMNSLLVAFVISLYRITKQPANRLQTKSRIYLFYFADCLLPRFFLIGIFNWISATFIMVFNASARSFSQASCFWSAAILACNT